VAGYDGVDPSIPACRNHFPSPPSLSCSSLLSLHPITLESHLLPLDQVESVRCSIPYMCGMEVWGALAGC
jgi:hypothetical protein